MKAPIIGYKIALRSGADLNNTDHYASASKRLPRAIRKARMLRMSNKDVMLFGERANGETFPVSLRIPKWECPKGNGCNSFPIVMPADLQKQVTTMKIREVVQAERIRKEA